MSTIVNIRNTITLTLIGNKLIATCNVNGEIFGQIYKTRKEALDTYFAEAANLEEKNLLADDSCILN